MVSERAGALAVDGGPHAPDSHRDAPFAELRRDDLHALGLQGVARDRNQVARPLPVDGSQVFVAEYVVDVDLGRRQGDQGEKGGIRHQGLVLAHDVHRPLHGPEVLRALRIDEVDDFLHGSPGVLRASQKRGQITTLGRRIGSQHALPVLDHGGAVPPRGERHAADVAKQCVGLTVADADIPVHIHGNTLPWRRTVGSAQISFRELLAAKEEKPHGSSVGDPAPPRRVSERTGNWCSTPNGATTYCSQ